MSLLRLQLRPIVTWMEVQMSFRQFFLQKSIFYLCSHQLMHYYTCQHFLHSNLRFIIHLSPWSGHLFFFKSFMAYYSHFWASMLEFRSWLTTYLHFYLLSPCDSLAEFGSISQPSQPKWKWLDKKPPTISGLASSVYY